MSKRASLMLRAVLPLAVAAVMLAPAASHASLVCQELVQNRACTDNGTHNINGLAVPAPVLPGFSSGCWSWNRQFQCVDPNPTYYCDSGDSFATVQATCSLTSAIVNSAIQIKSINYITSATFNYSCAFGQLTTNDALPNGQSCVQLSDTTTYGNTVAAANPGTPPDAGNGQTTSLTSSVSNSETDTQQYVCYFPPATTCSNTCYQNVTDPSTGSITQQAVACTSPVSNCVVSSDTCNSSATVNADGSLSGSESLGPDGRCVDSTKVSMCQAGDIPKCLINTNCSLQSTASSGVQDNGFATTQTQTYQCSNTTTTCTEVTNVSNCVHADAWGWDGMTLQSEVGQGLGDVNNALSQVSAIEQGINNNDPYIFSGQPLKCTYPVGNFLNTMLVVAMIAATLILTGGASSGMIATVLSNPAIMGSAVMSTTTANVVGAAISIGAAAAQDAPNSKAFGKNCCQDLGALEGSDAWYKLGSCTGDEVKLAVAKEKGLDYYLGDYCSKRGGFPIRQCVQRTKAYCVFDDMLALLVNEQGRQQLDQIAAADPTTTKATSAMSFNLYASYDPNATTYAGMNNGSWKQLTNTQNGFNSQIWYWQYPGYCQSSADQAIANNLYNAQVNAALSQQGIQPGTMTKAQAAQLLKNAVGLPTFQSCATTAGTITFMTCSSQDDTCSTSELPADPDESGSDYAGGDVQTVDVNWVMQQTQAYYKPGDYGVTAVMPTNSTYAAVNSSVNEYVTSTGSCHSTDGSCLFTFEITDKQAAGGLGAKKKTVAHAQFPLYTLSYSENLPSVTYMSQNGTLDTVAYMADKTRGLANPTTVSTQRFIFHPNYVAKPPSQIYSAVLLEYADSVVDMGNPANDYTPLVVPTTLPANTAGWYPYGDPSDNHKHFYLSGGCDPNTYWCNYEIDVDLNVARHPWGTPQDPACWGFTLEQMAALDFSKMDLSAWINSLDLEGAGDSATGLSASAASAMTSAVTQSAQNFYSAYSSGGSVTQAGAGTVALVLSASTLPSMTQDTGSSGSGNFTAYQETVAVPSNWPQYYTDDSEPNDNPVTHVTIDWGDGKTSTPTLATNSKGQQTAWTASHDYGDDAVGNYTVAVTLQTANNGAQRLTSTVTISPNSGDSPSTPQLNFTNQGEDGTPTSTTTPSQSIDGTNTAPANIEQLSPGTVDQFNNQGTAITAPDATAN
ncbi:conjugal transfer protein TraN [Burkholderia pyrrocinia]|nr:conjugal transfer protein TraN [Burkholderia pyrrocinia]EKS9892805.1 conjugal transfer protein TraN [Burkholderia pyrrocinia]EKS9907680.1 conjugal transfer protein TraN [Burkholderia pyrrocinia]